MPWRCLHHVGTLAQSIFQFILTLIHLSKQKARRMISWIDSEHLYKGTFSDGKLVHSPGKLPNCIVNSNRFRRETDRLLVFAHGGGKLIRLLIALCEALMCFKIIGTQA